jgi:hypothetical protein
MITKQSCKTRIVRVLSREFMVYEQAAMVKVKDSLLKCLSKQGLPNTYRYAACLIFIGWSINKSWDRKLH